MPDFLTTTALVRALFLLVIFAASSGALVAGWTVLSHRRAIQEQLARVKGKSGVTAISPSLRRQAGNGAWARMAQAIEAAGLDLSDTKQERLSVHLRAAGYLSAGAPRVFTLVRLVLLFLLPCTFLMLAWLTGRVPGFFAAYVGGTALALVGLYLPNLYVQTRINRRRDEITRGFPDCLDLLIVCVQSGLGVEASIDRVGREMALSHPLVAELLTATTLRLRAGASREDAFRKLAELAQVDEIRSFTTLIIQSDKLGTSIVATLRVYAGEMREMRRLRAEEKAHRLPVLMSVPLVTCLLPVMIGVMMLPAAIRLVRYIIPAMLGG